MCLFYAKPSYMLYQLLEWAHAPYAVSFIPEDSTYDGAKHDDEQVISIESCNKKHHVSKVEHCCEQGVEEESWKQQFAKFHVMLEHADFDLAD